MSMNYTSELGIVVNKAGFKVGEVVQKGKSVIGKKDGEIIRQKG